MNVDKYVKTLTEADCRKRFPKGYFAAAEKTSKGAGTVLIVMGVLFAPIGLWLLFQLGKFLIKEVPMFCIEEQWVTFDVRTEHEEEKWLNLILRKKKLRKE